MLDNIILKSLFSESTTAANFLYCIAASIILGLLIAVVYNLRNRTTKSFVVTLALLPVIVQMVIFLVNDSVGTGIAVAGAFSLVRFRSAPGTAKEIVIIFLSMAVGLATGRGYIGIAAVVTVVVLLCELIFSALNFGDSSRGEKELKITIPEGLNYQGVFDDIFKEYSNSSELVMVKTTNMGSLFQLCYHVDLKKGADEKKMIDEIRCRNGNLEISCGQIPFGRGEL